MPVANNRGEIDLKLPLLKVYSRPGCHLCELLVEQLQPLIRGRADVEVLDIDSKPEWTRKYGSQIPVVELDDQFLCQFHLDTDAITAALDSA